MNQVTLRLFAEGFSNRTKPQGQNSGGCLQDHPPSPRLAVDREIEQGKISDSPGHLETDPNRPGVLGQERTFLTEDAALVPGRLRRPGFREAWVGHGTSPSIAPKTHRRRFGDPVGAGRYAPDGKSGFNDSLSVPPRSMLSEAERQKRAGCRRGCLSGASRHSLPAWAKRQMKTLDDEGSDLTLINVAARSVWKDRPIQFSGGMVPWP